MALLISVLEQGTDLCDHGTWNLYYIQNPGFSGSDGRRQFPDGSSDRSSTDQQRCKSAADTADLLFCSGL